MKHKRLDLQAGCKTTAMGIMPHTDVARALELTMGLDIPFWPQLPHISFYEDMYAQSSENFPGITVNPDEEKIGFDTTRFTGELGEYSLRMTDPETFALSQKYSAVYHRFLVEDLQEYPAIRGQVTGPVSFGFRVTDEDNRPLIYNDEVRTLLFDFFQRKADLQCRQLREKNNNAFVWFDEPGLGWVFSGLSGYNDVQARQDYLSFLDGMEGPRALHLCASVNLPYLLELGIELLSFDAYQLEVMPKGYADAVAGFLNNGGIIAWGIVPTDSDNLGKETPESLANLLVGYWDVVSRNTRLPVKRIAEQSLIAPARCCLKNAGKVGASDEPATCAIQENASSTVEEQLVERAFSHLNDLSEILKDKFSL